MHQAPAIGAPFWVALTVTVTWACSETGLAGEALAARSNGPVDARAGGGGAAGRAGAGCCAGGAGAMIEGGAASGAGCAFSGGGTGAAVGLATGPPGCCSG